MRLLNTSLCCPAIAPSSQRLGSVHKRIANGHRTKRLSDRRLSITCSRISSGSIDMPPSGVTRRDFRLLRAAMNARSLACSVLGLLSFKKRAMHRSNNFIPRSVVHVSWNVSSAKGMENVLSFFDQSLVWPRHLSQCAPRV